MCAATDKEALPEAPESKPADVEVDSETTPESTEIVPFDMAKSALWCCGRGTVPNTGRDLGVWESSLEDRSNIFSSWFLTYLSPLLSLGGRKVLDAEDIGVPSKQDLADQAFSVAKEAFEVQSAKARADNAKLKAKYEAQVAKCGTDEARKKVKEPEYIDPSIAWALLKGFGVWTIVLAIAYYVVSALLGFVPILILNDLVRFFESGQTASEYNGYAHPWVEVVALGVVPIIISLFQTRHTVIMSHCAVFVRTAVSTMLYRKSLRVSAAGRALTSTGQVVNMMSNDTAQLQRFLQFAGMILVAPIQIIIALGLIFLQVGFDCGSLSSKNVPPCYLGSCLTL